MGAAPRLAAGQRMNITHFVENLERGGLERVVIDLALAQRDAGHDCRVVCLFRQGALADELLSQGIPVLECDKQPGMDLRAVARARALLRGQRGGVLHTHNGMAHYYAALASVGLGLGRIVNTRHSMSSRDGALRREWFYRRSMRLTDHAVAVCEAARKRLAEEGVKPRCSLLSIPNGIHTERFAVADAASHRQLTDVLGLPADTLVVGTVGRLNRVKDQATLIRAFRRAREPLPGNVALVLVGDGALRAELETTAEVEGIRPFVHFLGDRNDVGQLLRGFDMFALSSVTEGYSMALLEACASALPIITTDVGGNGEIVRDGVNGRLVPARDATALAAAMGDVLRLEPMQRMAMGARGRAWVLEEGSFSRMAERYARLYAN
jgi:glycosyltransferase involved in cell wall biosynthesis